jgi:hypothetical protein
MFRRQVFGVNLGHFARRICFAWVALLGCASSPPASPRAVGEEGEGWPKLYQGALTDYVPAAGLRWLVVGSPRHFAVQAALQPTRERWLTRERVEAFASATGVDLAQTERALVAGFDLGTLYLADGSGWVAAPEACFAERLAGSAIVHRPHPQIWRVTGLAGSTPQALVRVHHDLIAVAVGDPTPARIVELRARGRLKSVVPAFQGAALSTLPSELLMPGPLRVYALGPFQGEWLEYAHGLLEGVQALGAALDVHADQLRLQLVLAGYFHADDRERLLASWQAVASSSFGALLGLDQPSEPVKIAASQTQLSLDLRLAAQPLLSGLQTLLSGDVDRLSRGAGPAGAAELPN